jgi:hypothetical protein
MTNPPYMTGPANDPNRPQPAGSAGPPPAPGASSFQYRPHDPYGTFAADQGAAQAAGPVLPPAPTFGQRWGILAMEGRPKQVTWILQALWIYLAVAVLLSLVSIAFSAVMAGVFSSSVGLVVNIVTALLVAAVVLVLIWAIAKESLGRFGFQDPRRVFYIGLGFLGLVALCGFIGSVKVPFALVQLLAVLLVLALIFTRPVAAWLKEPGNQPKAEQGADGPPGVSYQPPQWRDAAHPPAGGPVSPPPAPPTQQPPSNPGWPQPPR